MDPIISPDTRREDRLPPRQVLTRKWPVLHAGPVPGGFQVYARLPLPPTDPGGDPGADPAILADPDGDPGTGSGAAAGEDGGIGEPVRDGEAE